MNSSRPVPTIPAKWEQTWTGHPNRPVQAANAKLKRLCAESASRGGALTTFDKVAEAINLSPGRVTQLFGARNPTAETGVDPATLGKIVKAFGLDGIGISVETFYLNYDAFVAQVAPDAMTLVEARTPIKDADAEPTLPSLDWHPDKAEAYTDLAVLQVHPPRPLNSRADCYYLDASLRFEIAEHATGNRTVAIGLRKANLTFASPAFQIAHASLLGDAARPHEGVTARANGITVSSLPGETMLEGSPLGDYYFAVIEPAGTGEAVVTLTLSTAARSFAFMLIDDETDAPAADTPSLNKDAILNLIYGEALTHRRDAATGRLALARATVRRKSAK
jgi:hypothetical protein